MYQAVATALDTEAEELARRWAASAPSVAPRASDALVATDGERGTRLVHAIACAVRNDPGCYDAVMRRGWEAGVAAHADGSSLHYLLKELGLLESIVLYACERALEEHVPLASAAEGMALARRLHRYFQVILLAATKGFTIGYVDALRKRYQLMRHDLRNPLGTIRNAMSLMGDETVPAETRDNPRIRQMVDRNASSLEKLIRSSLSDDSTQAPAFAHQDVSLEGVARSVRRELRDETAEAGCELVVSEEMPSARVDSTGLELALKAAVAGVAQSAERGSTIAVELESLDAERAALRVRYRPRPGVLADVERSIAFASEVLGRAGGRVRVEADMVRLEVPVLDAPEDSLGGPAHPGDHLGGAGER